MSSQQILYPLFLFLCLFSSLHAVPTQVPPKELENELPPDGSVVPKSVLSIKAKELLEKGFLFIINKNCSKYKIEAVYSDEFVGQIKELNCSIGELSLDLCNKEIKCQERPNYRDLGIIFDILGTLKQIKCNILGSFIPIVRWECIDDVDEYPIPQRPVGPPQMPHITTHKPVEPPQMPHITTHRPDETSHRHETTSHKPHDTSDGNGDATVSNTPLESSDMTTQKSTELTTAELITTTENTSSTEAGGKNKTTKLENLLNTKYTTERYPFELFTEKEPI